MTIRARYQIPLDDFTLNARFSVPDRGVTAVFGPSGSGKTSSFYIRSGNENLISTGYSCKARPPHSLFLSPVCWSFSCYYWAPM